MNSPTFHHIIDSCFFAFVRSASAIAREKVVSELHYSDNLDCWLISIILLFHFQQEHERFDNRKRYYSWDRDKPVNVSPEVFPLIIVKIIT